MAGLQALFGHEFAYDPVTHVGAFISEAGMNFAVAEDPVGGVEHSKDMFGEHSPTLF